MRVELYEVREMRHDRVAGHSGERGRRHRRDGERLVLVQPDADAARAARARERLRLAAHHAARVVVARPQDWLRGVSKRDKKAIVVELADILRTGDDSAETLQQIRELQTDLLE